MRCLAILLWPLLLGVSGCTAQFGPQAALAGGDSEAASGGSPGPADSVSTVADGAPGGSGDAEADLDGASTPPPSSVTGHAHARCGWIEENDGIGYDTFAAHASWFDAIHPDWWGIGADGASVVERRAAADDPRVVEAARANDVLLIPLVAGVDDPGAIRAMINDADLRAAHVGNLVDLALSHGYDGLDIDYEHLWTAADQAPFTQFVEALAVAMHDAGLQVSVAVPALAEPVASCAWDYVALAAAVDTLHITAYEYHTVGTHEGPQAPLGWVRATAEYAASTGYGSKFVMGLPNYGSTPSWWCDTADCVAACGGAYETVSSHMSSCSYGDWEEGRSPNCETEYGRLYFDDAESLGEKLDAALDAGLGGFTYWNLGKEPDGFWERLGR